MPFSSMDRCEDRKVLGLVFFIKYKCFTGVQSVTAKHIYEQHQKVISIGEDMPL